MTNQPRISLPLTSNTDPPDEKARLLEEFGDLFEDEPLSEAQKAEFLMTLWQIMKAFADIGFSIKSGDKLSPNSDIGMDDVLSSLIFEDTAHETVAPEFNNKTKNKEQR